MKLHHHVRAHFIRHKHKYIGFGAILSGGFLAVKLLLFFATSLFFFNAQNDGSFAQEIILTWEVITGSVESTGDLVPGDELLWSGEVITWIVITGEVITWTVITGGVITWTVVTGEVITWTVVTGNVTSTGTELAGFITTWTWSFQSGIQITGLVISGAGISSGILPFSSVLRLSFISSEFLTGVHVFLWSGSQSREMVLSGALSTGNVFSGYSSTYLISLTGSFADVLSGIITYSTLSGTTGSLVWTSSLLLDSVFPLMTGLSITGNSTNLSFSFGITEPSKIRVVYGIHGVSGVQLTNLVNPVLSYSFSLSNLSWGNIYDVDLTLTDGPGNISQQRIVVAVNNSGSIKYNVLGTIMVYDASLSGVFVTGNVSTTTIQSFIRSLFKTQLDDFIECKSDIDYTLVNMKVNGEKVTLHMPQFKKSEAKTIVSAFSVFLVKKFEEEKLSSSELQEITEKFNNFLLILKLVKDDDNACSQNLSTYHMTQFFSAMKEYGLSLK